MFKTATTGKEVRDKLNTRKDNKMEKWEKDLELQHQLEDCFNDTCRMTTENPALSERVRESINFQQVIPKDRDITPILEARKAGRVIVSAKETLEAAKTYKDRYAERPGTGYLKTAVLNFANAFAPAGWGRKASRTQEECLCRESTLYKCLSSEIPMEQFYGVHQGDQGFTPLANADMVYTPDVTVFKTCEKVPELLAPEDWFDVDVITMAAPNISAMDRKSYYYVDEEKLLEMFKTRFNRMLSIAVLNRVDVLILGAFGCGGFGNDPAVVASAAASELEKFRYEFDTVEFAIPSFGRNKSNYRMFRLVLDRYLNAQ